MRRPLQRVSSRGESPDTISWPLTHNWRCAETEPALSPCIGTWQMLPADRLKCAKRNPRSRDWWCVVNEARSDARSRLEWTPDGRNILFVDLEPGDSSSVAIRLDPVDGGPARTIYRQSNDEVGRIMDLRRKGPLEPCLSSGSWLARSRSARPLVAPRPPATLARHRRSRAWRRLRRRSMNPTETRSRRSASSIRRNRAGCAGRRAEGGARPAPLLRHDPRCRSSLAFASCHQPDRAFSDGRPRPRRQSESQSRLL